MAKKLNMGIGMNAKGNSVIEKPAEKIKQLSAENTYNFKFIQKQDIHPNAKNVKYTQGDIELLKQSILVNGLRHNLSVIYDAEKSGYRIISGERRYHAICDMSDDDYNKLFPAGIPCKIEKANIDDIDEEIMLISANHDVRETSIATKRWEVTRLKELYSAKKANGEIKNIVTEIAKQLSISSRQAMKYINTDKLIPELSEILNAKGITLDEADNYATLSEDAQKVIVKLIKENGSVEPEEYKEIKKQAELQNKEVEDLKKIQNKNLEALKRKDNLISSLQKQVEELKNLTGQSDTDEINKQSFESRISALEKSLNKAAADKIDLQNKILKLKSKSEKAFTYDANSDEAKRVRRLNTLNAYMSTAGNSIKEIAKYKEDIEASPELKAQLAEMYAVLESLF